MDAKCFTICLSFGLSNVFSVFHFNSEIKVLVLIHKIILVYVLCLTALTCDAAGSLYFSFCFGYILFITKINSFSFVLLTSTLLSKKGSLQIRKLE